MIDFFELREGYKSPAEAQAIADGKKAARQGKKYSDNPHKKGTPEFTAWSKGHNMARESVEENKKSHPQGSAKFYRGAMDKYKAKTPAKSPWTQYMDAKRNKKESVSEGKNDYPLYHKTYSGAMQAAYAYAKKRGFEVDKDDIDRKVATGPRKPSNGKTNSFTLKLVGQKNKMLAVQVTNLDNQRYELNTYIT